MGFNLIIHSSINVTNGELAVANKIESLYKNINYDVYLFVQPRILNVEPDFILVDKYRGISIIEVKDWSIDYLTEITHKEVKSIDNRILINPVFRTNQYFNKVKAHLYKKDILKDIKNIYSNLIFININEEEGEKLEVFRQYPTNTIFTIRKKSIPNLELNSLFLGYCNLNDNQIDSIRMSIDPIITIPPKKNMDISIITKCLDIEQDKFIKRKHKGHYIVTGVPGSGKTAMLLSRAFYLLILNPTWKIVIITYNKSLMNKIKKDVEFYISLLKPLYQNIDFNNIEVINYHKLAMQYVTISVPIQKSKQQQFWDYDLAKNMSENVFPTYNAVLIDEYQDFYIDWLKSCIKLLIPNDDNSLNIFFAGDRLQSIYNDNIINWNQELNLDMRGKSLLLKNTYRVSTKPLKLGLEILKQDKKLKLEVLKFYKSDTESTEEEIFSNIHSKNKQSGYIEIFNDTNIVISKLKELLRIYEPKDILVLGRNKKELEKLFNDLSLELKNICQVGKDIKNDKIMFVTYHSSKGLETKVAFLLNVNFDDLRLLYVGLTRAEMEVYIHTKNDKIKEFIKKVI